MEYPQIHLHSIYGSIIGRIQYLYILKKDQNVLIYFGYVLNSIKGGKDITFLKLYQMGTKNLDQRKLWRSVVKQLEWFSYLACMDHVPVPVPVHCLLNTGTRDEHISCSRIILTFEKRDCWLYFSNFTLEYLYLMIYCCEFYFISPFKPRSNSSLLQTLPDVILPS